MNQAFFYLLSTLIILSSSQSFADCQVELERQPLFDLSVRDQQEFKKIYSIYVKIKNTATNAERLQTHLPEYSSDFKNLGLVLSSWIDEFRIITKILTAERILVYPVETVLKNYLSELEYALVLGPTYADVLFAGFAFAEINSYLMALRVRIHRRENAFDQPIRRGLISIHSPTFRMREFSWAVAMAARDILLLFTTNQTKDLSDPIREMRQLIHVKAEATLSDNFKIIPIPYFKDTLMSFDLAAELSQFNLNIEQTVTQPKMFLNLDGSLQPSDPRFLLLHDEQHTRFLKGDNEDEVVQWIIRSRKDLIQKNVQWIELFKLLIFYHRHELGRNLSTISDDLPKYREIAGTSPATFNGLAARMHGDLKGVVSASLFDQDWDKFIQFLNR